MIVVVCNGIGHQHAGMRAARAVIARVSPATAISGVCPEPAIDDKIDARGSVIEAPEPRRSASGLRTARAARKADPGFTSDYGCRP